MTDLVPRLRALADIERGNMNNDYASPHDALLEAATEIERLRELVE